MTAILQQLGLFTAYALVGGSVAFALAIVLDKNLQLSALVRKWLYLAVLMLPVAIYGIHALTPCNISPDRVLPAICHLAGPYTSWLGGGTLLVLLYSFRSVKLIHSSRARQWNNSRAEAQVSAILNGRIFKIIDSEYPQAFVEGWLHPVIGITRGLYEILDAAELEAVLMHEVAHVENRDNLLSVLALLLRGLASLSPASYAAFVRYEEAREATADEAVNDSLGLASALVKAGKRGLLLQSSLSSCLRSSSASGRIENLLTGRNMAGANWLHVGMLASLLVVLLIC